MRHVLLLCLLFRSSLAGAQTYSRVIPDSTIVDFINRDILRDSFSGTHHIYTLIAKPAPDAFYYRDSADWERLNRSMPDFIFKRHVMRNGKVFSYGLDTLFSREDIDYFREQINGLRKRERWKDPFVNSVLEEHSELDATNHVRNVRYRYSIPVFSKDHNRAIIIRSFYCGLLCGGGAFYVYRRNDRGWVLEKKFGEWGE
ncbi:MAG: hypothetical protein EOO16_01420 [Chitinophagaceae bacterium]|nr:MAG: hypothetical protein EOO16_01420 [Chitinophagaceae bacterium]